MNEHSTYETLRQFADSWGLLYLAIVFVAVVLFTFRPGTHSRAEQAAQIPLKEDD
jgi:cytochrome c oxidase cbb3-type subunit 4